jgi:hypothetical protein
MGAAIREGLPALPVQMRDLPVDHRGYPVPKFVEWIDGKPDFRVMSSTYFERALTLGLCWICGCRRPKKFAFVIGPMCAINRVSAEPPSCIECADFAAKACPFLTMPKARRREAGMPEDAVDPAGFSIRRNPGVALVWITSGFKLIPAGRDGLLFEVGTPKEVRWYAEGRTATRAEVLASIWSGTPELARVAADEGPEAMAHLAKLTERAMVLVPA